MAGGDNESMRATRGYGRRAVVSDELRDTVKKMRNASNRFNAIVKDMSKEFGEDKG
jgi:hypothetical protein